MTHNAQSGHPGGSMSAADIVTALSVHVARVDPKNPTWPDRDRFVLSKGHACPVWYAALAERGFFPVEELMTFRKLNSRLQGHPELGTTPGVENAAGAEGQGLSFSVGLALAPRMDHKAWRTYCVLGDGEQDVGQTWEAAMAASSTAWTASPRSSTGTGSSRRAARRTSCRSSPWPKNGRRSTGTSSRSTDTTSARSSLPSKRPTARGAVRPP